MSINILRNKLPENLISFCKSLIYVNIELLIGIVMMRVTEMYMIHHYLPVQPTFWKQEILGLLVDFRLWSLFTIGCFIFYLIHLINKNAFIIMIRILNVSVLLLNILLIIFFKERGAPLDEEFFQLSLSESLHVVKSSGYISLIPIVIMTIGGIALIAIPYIMSKILQHMRITHYLAAFAVFIGSIAALLSSNLITDDIYKQNKLAYFVKQSINFAFEFRHGAPATELTTEMRTLIHEYQSDHQGEYLNDSLPFYRKLPKDNPLGIYFTASDKAPNVVIIIIESLSSQLSGTNPPMGNYFTPFIDSLASKSLYWKNCMSSSPLSFEALPTLLGSLPFGRQGFNILPQYPDHNSLISLLKKQGYQTSFICGSPMFFDNQGTFIRHQDVDYITNTFPEKYSNYLKQNEWNWGYPDEVVFKHGLERVGTTGIPRLDVFVTISTHPPFIEQYIGPYREQFIADLEYLQKDIFKKEEIKKLADLGGSFRYCDEKLRQYFAEYRKKSSYSNTIFIITGDHHAYFTAPSQLEQMRVPLIIYSPMLKTTKLFPSLVSHHDVVPSICNLLNETFRVPMPSYGHWLGNMLDTSSIFQSNLNIPIAGFGRSVSRYIYGKYYFEKEGLHEILNDNLEMKHLNDSVLYMRMSKRMARYSKIDDYVCYGNYLMPRDSTIKDLTFTAKISDSINSEMIITSNEFPLNQIVSLGNNSKKLKVCVSFDAYLPRNGTDQTPSVVVSIETGNNKVFYDEKNTSYMNIRNDIFGQWLTFSIENIINTHQLALKPDTKLSAYIWNKNKQNIKIKNFRLQIFKSTLP